MQNPALYKKNLKWEDRTPDMRQIANPLKKIAISNFLGFTYWALRTSGSEWGRRMSGVRWTQKALKYKRLRINEALNGQWEDRTPDILGVNQTLVPAELTARKKSRRLSTFPERIQYHRRKRAWLPCSEWERVLPLHYGHRHFIQCQKRSA